MIKYFIWENAILNKNIIIIDNRLTFDTDKDFIFAIINEIKQLHINIDVYKYYSLIKAKKLNKNSYEVLEIITFQIWAPKVQKLLVLS